MLFSFPIIHKNQNLHFSVLPSHWYVSEMVRGAKHVGGVKSNGTLCVSIVERFSTPGLLMRIYNGFLDMKELLVGFISVL